MFEKRMTLSIKKEKIEKEKTNENIKTKSLLKSEISECQFKQVLLTKPKLTIFICQLT